MANYYTKGMCFAQKFYRTKGRALRAGRSNRNYRNSRNWSWKGLERNYRNARKYAHDGIGYNKIKKRYA